MNRLLTALYLLSPFILFPQGQAQAQASETFYMQRAYRASLTSSLMDIAGHEPSEEGTYPVYIWTTGTVMTFWSPDDKAYTEAMADRGFVAASVQYQNLTYPVTCAGLTPKAEAIFNPNLSKSAIRAICDRPKADCSKGIVVSGFSQGAHIASLAANYDERIEAAYLMGNGFQATNSSDLSPCLGDDALALPQSRRRSMVGENDDFFGCDVDGQSCNRAGVREQQMVTTGYDGGPTAFDCIQGDGSGFYIVKDSETADGKANHCYTYEGICGPTFDAAYDVPGSVWGFDTNLDWLAEHLRESP